jgi:hypothetical protein
LKEEVTFFGMDEAYAKAREKFGPRAAVWSYDGRLHLVGNDRTKMCQIGTAGAGYDGLNIKGTGSTWLEAVRNAGLL